MRKIKGDASVRTFYRKKYKNFSSIIVFSKKEKTKNLLIYDSINKILNKNKIQAPRLYQENYKRNNIEIEDFGNKTIFKILIKKKVEKFQYFKKIILTLNQLQLIKDRKVKNFKNLFFKIPEYKKEILIQEANLFCEWYVKKFLPQNQKDEFIHKFKKIIKKLSLGLKLKNDVFVHRDFHISNLMLVDNKIGVIDSQDALIGNRAYDLASLIDDVRLETSIPLKKKIFNFYLSKQKKMNKNKFSFNFYLSKQKKMNKNKFKNDFEILSILRNLKIIGIFTRLAERDGKKKYLKLIPYAWFLINLRINENKIFVDLKKLLNKSFKKKIK